MTTATREAARPSAVPLRPIPVPAQIQRCGGVQCAPGICDHNQDEKVHRFADGTPGPARIPATVAAVLRTPGQALDASTRGGMEERFGHDFGQVRVHTDAEAARSAQAIHAQAYTLGRHVVMGQGRYEPHTASGMRLLAHELTHVVQQGNPTTDTGPARAISHHHDPSEREADHVAGALTGSTGAPHRHEAPQIAAPGMLQRQDDDDFPFGGGDFGGGGAGGTFDGPATPTAGPATTRAVPVVCSRPLDFPAWTGLRNFRHAYINDPPANYAIRGLVSGNGVTTSCSTATDASGPPDEPATSICKPCQPAPGQSVADVSRCLRSTHTAYPNPNLYRNLPDPNDGWRHGPNSNSYAAAMARCCYAFSPAGLGRLPGWSHSPAGPCPTTVTPGESEGPVPGGGQPSAGPAPGAPPAGIPGEMRQVDVQPVFFKDSAADLAPTGVSWNRRFVSTQDVWGKLGVLFTPANAVEIIDANLKTAGGNRAERDQVRGSWNGAAVGVFMVDNDIADAGGAATVGGGAAGAKIALSDLGASDTLMAHEMGHVLGLGHPPGGADPDTIMEPSGSNDDPNPTRNTIGNYNLITWPAPSGSIIINPDP